MVQQLRTDTEGTSAYSAKNLNTLQCVIKTYGQMLVRLSLKRPILFENLYNVGLKEIFDHYTLLKKAKTATKRALCYEDFLGYLRASLEDCNIIMTDYKPLKSKKKALNPEI